MKVIVIDNYDSFVYNLVHLLRRLDAEVRVGRNDRCLLEELEAYDKILLSPGPGLPSESGLLLDVIRTYAGRKPILGVCLGHQAIAEVFGARLHQLAEVCHGIATPCLPTTADYLLAGLPNPFTVGRYHSWGVAPDSLPSVLEPIAAAPDGTLMALRHRTLDLRGVQFHPESVLTPEGEILMHNWLSHSPC